MPRGAEYSELQREVADALTVIRGVAVRMAENWETMSAKERSALTEMLARRSEELQARLMPILRQLSGEERND